MKDLFEHYKELPQEVKDIIDKYEDKHFNFTYDECNQLVKELETVGYTCEYGLDATPYGLCKIDD